MGSTRFKTVQRKSQGGARRVALIVTLLCSAALAVLGGLAFRTIHNIGGEGGAKSVIETLRDPRAKFPADKSRLNIIVYGKDYDYDSMGNRFTQGSGQGRGSRTDSIVVASLDLDRKTISLLSIPRDTRIEGEDGKIGKINAVYRNHGRESFLKTVTNLLGVEPDYYVGIKSDAMGKVVDTLGGVEVETLDAMEYVDAHAGLHINLPKGKQVVNGEQAIGFARFREADIYERDEKGMPIYLGYKDRAGNPVFKRRSKIVHSEEEGDPRRMARQQQLIKAMAKRATSGANLFQLDHLVNVTLEQLETNLDRMQIFAIAALFRTANPDSIVTGTLQGHGEIRGGTYMVILDKDKKKAAVDWLLKGDETAANHLTVVSVENATEIRGAARRVGDLLKQEGFDVAHMGNATHASTAVTGSPTPPSGAESTRIIYVKASFAQRAQRIAELIGGGMLEKSRVPDHAGVEGYEHELSDIRVILGRDLAVKYATLVTER